METKEINSDTVLFIELSTVISTYIIHTELLEIEAFYQSVSSYDRFKCITREQFNEVLNIMSKIPLLIDLHQNTHVVRILLYDLQTEKRADFSTIEKLERYFKNY